MLREILVSSVIVSVCLVLHVVAIVLLGERLIRWRGIRDRTVREYGFILIIAFLGLIIVHLAEIAIWAGFYFQNGLFSDFETSLYFSTTSYTTIGFGDVVLPRAWRLLGGIEAVSGVLLVGLSTAFVFAIVNALFQTRLQRVNRNQPGAPA